MLNLLTMRQAHSNITCPKCGYDEYGYFLGWTWHLLTFGLASPSAVYYQDQSKRKETRMILFYVCCKCNHTFLDPALPPESRIDL